ncbi:MAG TPA: OmpH family outer membrane protein [Acidobacteriota bacterium]|nr:OmpH family outer membrane protein [Acidobacteriota bacterium]
MNRISGTICWSAATLALTILLTAPLVAQQEAAPAGEQMGQGVMVAEKMGFLSFRGALQATNEVKAQIADIQKFVDEKNTESTQKIDAINSLQEEINAKARSLNSETLEEMRTRLERLRTDLKRFQEDTQREINRRRDRLFQTYGPKLQAVINEYAQANSYSVIFLTDEQSFGYIDPQWELTEEVAAAYNEKHPAQAPDASPSASESAPPPSKGPR